MDTRWTEKWPTEPGWYWLYSQKGGDYEPNFRLIRVYQSHCSLVYITDGHYLCEAESVSGLWCRAELPEPPDWEA